MKEYLLDTHTIIWYARKSSKLSNKSISVIDSIENNIFISDISIWEIAIKIKIGKLDIDLKLSEFISIIDKMNFNWLKIKHNHIEETLNFPLHH